MSATTFIFEEIDESFFDTLGPQEPEPEIQREVLPTIPTPYQTEEQAYQTAVDYLNFIIKLKLPAGRSCYFPRVIEFIENGEIDLAVISLSEALRGKRFSDINYWCERITFWRDSQLEHDRNAFGMVKVLPYRVYYNLTERLSYDEEVLHSLFDIPILK
jgi:hypothetical protein